MSHRAPCVRLYPPAMPGPAASALLFTTLLLQAAPPASQFPAPARLAEAGKLYYTPNHHGLNSFHCDLALDWTAYMKAAASLGGHDPSEITPDNPMIKYFAASHLTVDDDPLSGAKVTLTGLPPQPPELPAGLGDTMARGTELAARMFFDFWNPLVNGTLFDPAAPGITIEPHGDGLRVVQSGTAPPVTEEIFDKQLRLTNFHARIDGYDSPVTPDFQATPNGLRPQALHIAFKNPAADGTIDVTLKTTYTTISGYDLPATYSTTVDGTKFFEATLQNCTVKTTH